MTGDVHLASQGQAACRRGPLDPGPDLRALDAPGPSFQGDGGTANQHAGQTCLLSRQPRAASTARSPRRLSTESWAPGPRQLLRLPPRGGMHPRGPLRWESGPSSGAQGALGMGCRQLPTLVSTHTRTLAHTLVHRHAHVYTQHTHTLTPCHAGSRAHSCTLAHTGHVHSQHTHVHTLTRLTCTHTPSVAPGPSPLQDVTPTSRVHVSSPQAQAQPIAGPLGPPQARPPGSPHHRCGLTPG